MKFRMYIVKGHFQPFWYKHHYTIDKKGYLYTVVFLNLGIQIVN